MTLNDTAVTGTVYGISDPRDNLVRYIGQTTQTLTSRLTGHLAKPSAAVNGWFARLRADGVEPAILPLRENVPADDLLRAERDEITRRLAAGAALLNVANNPVRAQQRAERLAHEKAARERARREQERSAWETTANLARSVLGGPPPPGDLPPVPLGDVGRNAYQHVREAAASTSEDERWRLRVAEGEAGEALWKHLKYAWPDLEGRLTEHGARLFEARVSRVVAHVWEDLRNAERYLSLVPWSLLAVAPWAVLADRAGMDTRSHVFITWVSDAPEVRDALRFLLMDIGDRLGPLANEEGDDLHRRPSAMLAALAYAYSPHADVPDALRHSVKGALRDLARNRQLTPPMVELMLRLNPNALDDEFGPDIAGDIDARLSLPSGTTGRVLAELLQERSAPSMPWISRVADRAHQVIPTVATPDYRRWMGSGTASREVIFGSLVAAGHVLPRSGQSVAEHLATVRDVWAARTSSTRPGAAPEG